MLMVMYGSIDIEVNVMLKTVPAAGRSTMLAILRRTTHGRQHDGLNRTLYVFDTTLHIIHGSQLPINARQIMAFTILCVNHVTVHSCSSGYWCKRPEHVYRVTLLLVWCILFSMLNLVTSCQVSSFWRVCIKRMCVQHQSRPSCRHVLHKKTWHFSKQLFCIELISSYIIWYYTL